MLQDVEGLEYLRTNPHIYSRDDRIEIFVTLPCISFPLSFSFMANLLSLNGWSSGLCQVSLAFYSKNLYCGLPCKGLPLLVPSLYP